MQQDGGKSIIAAKTDNFFMTSDVTMIENLFIAMNFTGLAMVEIRKREDKNFMIEANPRFWGPSQLFVDAKYNLFHAMLNDWGFCNIPFPDINTLDMNAKYFWEGGITEDVRLGRNSAYFDGFDKILGYNRKEWEAAEIYKRSDTIKIWEAENLYHG
ncbi:MAG: hypothetical protein IJP89_11635 [Synergistaceae bacterium]|nr:hypothetical protein [Synergistaceae bacterium]MBR0257030.1 hypothetical protein [Synergistaceae bacterium]